MEIGVAKIRPHQSDFAENALLLLVLGALKIPFQQALPSLRFSWIVTGVLKGKVGRWMLMPFPARLIFAFPAAPGFRVIFVSPSLAPFLSAYLKPSPGDFQQGLVPQVPPAAAVAVILRALWSYKHMV